MYIDCVNSLPLQLLIRLEKYHHRINFELGFLGSTKQTYGHLKRKLVEIATSCMLLSLINPENDTSEYSNRHRARTWDPYSSDSTRCEIPASHITCSLTSAGQSLCWGSNVSH